MTATATTPTAAPDVFGELIDRIDLHLASMPAGRTIMDVGDHLDTLLDIRNLVTREAPADAAPDDLVNRHLFNESGLTDD